MIWSEGGHHIFWNCLRLLTLLERNIYDWCDTKKNCMAIIILTQFVWYRLEDLPWPWRSMDSSFVIAYFVTGKCTLWPVKWWSHKFIVQLTNALSDQKEGRKTFVEQLSPCFFHFRTSKSRSRVHSNSFIAKTVILAP